MVRYIGLVAPSRRRRGSICRAREQFELSHVFRRARDFCERAYGEWYILSTQHYLLAPQQVIGGGEPPLATMQAAERQAWAERVAQQLRERGARSAEPVVFVLYGSQRYAELLMRAAPFATIELPLAGMSLRERIRWYDERLQIRARVLTRPLAR
jgi:hypothetical protein